MSGSPIYYNLQPDFAMMGSGNLSVGGLRDNTGCSLYIQNPDFIKELDEWFEHQFSSAFRFTSKLIKKYE
jgi:phosphatidylserine/phosphatidylglycerophosphate/cardiolipin synthase-like enzyme